MIGLLASALISASASAAELVSTCRAMIPESVELSGQIVMRSRRGITMAEHDYVLRREKGLTHLSIDGAALDLAKEEKTASLLGTDVTVSDLTLDYLWWNDVSFDAEREGESVNACVCSVVVLRQGARIVRAWIDRKTGALMQAEEWREDKPVRRLWGTRLKKFGDRWMANVLEVETLSSGHRTKITVETLT